MRLLELGEAVADGIISIPTDLYYGTRRTAEDFGIFGQEIQKENREELQSIGKLIGDALKNRNIIQRAVMLILDDFFEHLPTDVKEKILQSSTNLGVKIVGRTGTQLALSRVVGEVLAKKVTDRIFAQQIIKVGSSLVLSAIVIQGLIERSSNASKRLKKANPRLFDTLKKQNLEPLYFLFEETLAPIVSSAVYERLDYRKYNLIMEDLKSRFE